MKTEFKITKLMLMEMPGYRDQYRHVLEGTQESLNDVRFFANYVNGLGEAAATPEVVAADVHKLLRFNSLPEASHAIPFGWDDPRYSFLLEIETTSPTGMKELIRVAGYTDRIAPVEELDFFINSTTTWHKHLMVITADGPHEGYSLSAQDHLHADLQAQVLSHTEGYSELMRPADVFARLQTIQVVDSEHNDVVDLRSRLSSATVRTDRDNVVPAIWLSKLVEAHLSALTDEVDVDQKQVVWDLARAHATEGGTNQSTVLRRLADLRDKATSNQFSFKDLEAMDREVSEKTLVMSVSENHTTLSVIHGEHEDWSVEQPEAIVAYAIAMAAPVLLNENFLSGALFRVEYAPANPAALQTSMLTVSPAFVDLDVSEGISQFLDSFEQLVLQQVLPGSDPTTPETVYLEVDTDLYGSTVVVVAFDTPENAKRFVIPTFADSLLSPIVSMEDAKTSAAFADLTLLANALEPMLDRLEAK